MKATDLLIYAEKKEDPEEATQQECARIAARERNYVWSGQPPLKRRRFGQFLLEARSLLGS